MSSGLDPDCSCDVPNFQEEVTPYTSWSCFDSFNNRSESERHAYSLTQMLNKDRKEDQTYTDGTLQVENKTFAVHKCIIGSMIDNFERICSVSEKQENVANDMTPARLELLLEYVYTGCAGLTEENVCTTLEDALYLQLKDLEKSCWMFMERRMDADNCMRFRDCAHKHSERRVVDKANVTITENAVKLIKLEAFKKIPFNQVLEILTMHKDQIVEEEILECCESWINREPETRRDHFASFIELVDFSFLSSKFIKSRIQKEGEPVLNPEYNEKLINELKARENDHKENNIMILGRLESWIINIRTQEKRTIPRPTIERQGESAVTDGKKVLVFGGNRNETTVLHDRYRKVEELNLSCPTEWRPYPSLITGRRQAACVMLNGNCYITGGKQTKHRICQTCECYCSDKKEWTVHSKMLFPRMSHGMVVLNGSLFVLGGRLKWPLASVEHYDPILDKWVLDGPMRIARFEFGAVVVKNKIFVIGGKHRKDRAAVEMYCEAADQWTLIEEFNIARHSLEAFVLEGKIFVVGGVTMTNEEAADEVVCYDPSTGKCSVKFRLKIPFLSTILAI